MSVNKAIIVGRLGKDPELRSTPGGRAVANFDLATESVWKDRDGQRQKQTEWHRVVVWGPQAESCAKHLAKGREVYVEGEIRTRSYEDKKGEKRSVTEIIARDVRFLGGNQVGTREDQGRDDRDDGSPYGPHDPEAPF